MAKEDVAPLGFCSFDSRLIATPEVAAVSMSLSISFWRASSDLEGLQQVTLIKLSTSWCSAHGAQ